MRCSRGILRSCEPGMRYPRKRPESNHLLTVRGATLQILATCPVVKIVFIAGSSRNYLSLRGTLARGNMSHSVLGLPTSRPRQLRRMTGLTRFLLICTNPSCWPGSTRTGRLDLSSKRSSGIVVSTNAGRWDRECVTRASSFREVSPPESVYPPPSN